MKLPRYGGLPYDISHFRPRVFPIILQVYIEMIPMKRFLRVLIWVLSPILLIWLALTLWVQQPRAMASWTTEPEGEKGKALILYNPDPIYDLDAQLARAFSEGLASQGWASEVAAYETFQDSIPPQQDLCILIANTYNWAPDWPTRHFIERASWLEGQPVVALTLGSGATGRSQRFLEEVLEARRVVLKGSRTYWLLRPNDESRPGEPNVRVARDLVRTWAGHLAAELEKHSGNLSN